MTKPIIIMLAALILVLALTNGWTVIAIACCLAFLMVADVVSASVKR